MVAKDDECPDEGLQCTMNKVMPWFAYYYCDKNGIKVIVLSCCRLGTLMGEAHDRRDFSYPIFYNVILP